MKQEETTGLQVAGALLLYTPLLLCLLPGAPALLDRLYDAQDELQLKRFRRQWLPVILSFLIVVPDIMLLRQDTDSDGELAWRFIVLYLYAILPMLVCMFRPDVKLPLDTGDVVIIVLLALPAYINYYAGVVPDVRLKFRDNWPRISMLQMTGVNVALVIFNGLRPLRDLGFTVLLKMQDLYRFLVGFVISIIVLLPIVYASAADGSDSSENPPSFGLGLAELLAIFIIIALPQELLFHGVFQNLLNARLETNANISKYTAMRGSGGDDEDVDESAPADGFVNYKSIRIRNASVTDRDDGDVEANDDWLGDAKLSDNKRWPTYQAMYNGYFAEGPLQWLNLPNARDWIALLITSMVFAFIAADQRAWGDKLAAADFFLAAGLALVTGYTWRQTSKVTVSAALHALVLFFAIHVWEVQVGATLHYQQT